MKTYQIGLIAAACLGVSNPALAASDYLLKLDGIDGEAAVSGEILGYSWGMANPGAVAQAGVVAPRDVATGQASGKRDAASGLPTGKRQHLPAITASQNTQSLRVAPTLMADGRAASITGDLDGDGTADFIDATRVDEIDGFTLTFDKASPVLAKMCANGKHFTEVKLLARGQELTIENPVVTGCTAGGAARSINGINGGMPNRISMNVTVPRQTQGATFGEKVCTGMACGASSLVTVTLTGQLKHTKTGHVTLMK